MNKKTEAVQKVWAASVFVDFIRTPPIQETCSNIRLSRDASAF